MKKAALDDNPQCRLFLCSHLQGVITTTVVPDSDRGGSRLRQWWKPGPTVVEVSRYSSPYFSTSSMVMSRYCAITNGGITSYQFIYSTSSWPTN